MTNFEKHKHEILEITDLGYHIAVIFGEPYPCANHNCGVCELSYSYPNCTAALINWFAEEYVEK
ncbi:MAG: hypothetical protein ACI4E1_07705 [Lachnospira sp.]